MAGRSHVDVNERRLKPIYDYIDNRNYKKAVQEADRVLKKQKDLHCAKALKGLALLRQGKHDSGLELLHEVHEQHPTDDATLQALTISYGELQELDLIVDLYEHANQLKPENEDLLSALFMAYVRTGSYQKQQRTAMALHKLKPNKNPYYFWALMSIVMQAHTSEEEVKKMTFLKLAERMAEKFITEKKVEAEAEVMMYLIILELQGKFPEAYDLVNGVLGAKFQELNFRAIRSAELLEKMEKWPQMNTSYKSLLLNEPDQWCYYQSYIKSVIKLVKINHQAYDVEGDLPVDTSVEQAQWFIRSRITCCQEKQLKCRAPHLAELELIRQLSTENVDCSTLSDPYVLLSNYCKLFWHKSCCYNDVKTYLNLISQDQLETLVSEMESELELRKTSGEPVYPEDESILRRHLTTCHLRHHLAATWSRDADDLLTLAREYCSRHEHGLRFGTDKLSTDYQSCDDYLLLATAIYQHLHTSFDNEEYLWTIIVLLERGLITSPSNFRYKLLLVHYYSILGAFAPAAEHWEKLDIKHIQHDSLGYIMVNHAVKFGHYRRTGEIVSNMLKFFTLNSKETTDYLISAYKYGSFGKIHEFVKFRQRLQNSFQFAAATAEKLHLDLLVDPGADCGAAVLMDIDPEHDKTVLSELVDNRDLNVLQLSVHPDLRDVLPVRVESFIEEKNWLKIRNLTIRILAAASQFDSDGSVTINLHPVKNGNQPSRCMHEVLSELMVQLQEHVTGLGTANSDKYSSICGVTRTRISQYLKESHSTILIDFCKCLLHLYKYSIKTDDGVGEDMKFSCCDRLSQVLDDTPSCCRVINDEIQFDSQHLERLVMLTELVCQVTLIVTVAYRLLKPIKLPGQKRGKKRPTTKVANLDQIISNYNGLVEKVIECYDKIERVIEESQMAMMRLTIQGFDELDLTQKQQWEERRDCMRKVLASYQVSAGNMTLILQKKKSCLKMFDS